MPQCITSTLNRAFASAVNDGFTNPGTSGTARMERSRCGNESRRGSRSTTSRPELREELQNAARLARARRVVVARDENDRRLRQRADQPVELQERVEDRLVRRADGVKDVARHDDELGPQLDHPIDHQTERRGDVGFALVDPGGRQPLILPVAEVQVGEVNQAHAAGGVERI